MNIRNSVTKNTLINLERLAVQRPSFFDSFKFNKEVYHFPQEVRTLKGWKLKQKLLELNKNVSPFFRETNEKFLTETTTTVEHTPKRRSEVWTQPDGILKSVSTPRWKILANFKSGHNTYPIDFRGEDKKNIFMKKNIAESYVLNPPFRDFDAPRSEEPEQPLRNHVKKIRELAIDSGKPQLVMFPQENKKKDWFKVMVSDFLTTPLFFKNPVIFTRGEEREIRGVPKFRIVVLIFGIYSPQDLEVDNNILGNFRVKQKLFRSLQNVFSLPNIMGNEQILMNFFRESLSFQQKCHLEYQKQSTRFPEYEFRSNIDRFSLINRVSNRTQLDYHQQGDEHEFFVKRMLKIPNGSKKITYRIPNVPKKLLKKKVSFVPCMWCGTRGHSRETCTKNPVYNLNTPDETDNKTASYILSTKPLKLQHYGGELPTSVEFQEYLKQIDTFKEKIIRNAPGDALYWGNTHFSSLRNHWPYLLALGETKYEVLNAFLGYNIHSNLGNMEYPNVEVLAPPPKMEIRTKIYEKILQLLKENKVWRTQRKNIHMVAPVFLLEGYNSVGKFKQRLIHDFSYFAEFFSSTPYRLDSIAQVQAKFRGKVCISVDVSSAFYHGSLRYSNIIGFSAHNPVTETREYFAAATPLFGHQMSPFICYSFLRFLPEHFERINFMVNLYVDDFLFGVMDEKEKITEYELNGRIKYIVEVFERVGIRISPKLEILPTNFFLYIGKNFHTGYNLVLPNIRKIPVILKNIEQCLKTERIKLKVLESLRGKLSYLTQNEKNAYFPLLNTVISEERRKFPQGEQSEKEYYKKLYNRNIKITNEMELLLLEFFNLINKTYFRNFRDNTKRPHDFIIAADASIDTVGAVLVNQQGVVRTATLEIKQKLENEQENSSTYRELISIQKALLTFWPQIQQKTSSSERASVLIINDNRININNLSRLGAKQKKLRREYTKFFNVLQNLEIDYELRWEPRECIFNRVADRASKNLTPKFRWQDLRHWLRKREIKVRESVRIVSKPETINLYQMKKLHLVKTLGRKKQHIFILSPFTEPTFYKRFLETLKKLRLRFVILNLAMKTQVKRAVEKLVFPTLVQKGPFEEHKIRFPYVEHQYKMLVSHNIF